MCGSSLETGIQHIVVLIATITLCVRESIFVTQKNEKAEFSFIFFKILLCLGNVNWLFLSTQHPFSLLLVMHNYFLGGGGVFFSFTTTLIPSCAHDKGCQSVYFISLDRVMYR